MKYTKEQIAKVAHECAKQEAFHDNEYLGKIGCMLDDLLGRIAELEKDAKRYRWLSNRMLGVDFDWCENGITALAFEMPDGCAYGGNCDQNIDTAMQKD